MSKSSKKEVKEVFKWTEVLRKNLVEMCLEAHARGNFTDSGFKSAEWSKIEEKFNSISGEMKANRQQLQNQLAELKGFHTMYGYIVNQLSGFSIDPDTGLPTASEKCWEDFIKAHPKAGRFKTKPFPLFNDLQTLFAGKVATGQFAISSTGATKRKIEDDISVDDSSDESFGEFLGIYNIFGEFLSLGESYNSVLLMKLWIMKAHITRSH